jgi:hypothetical protein
MIDRSRLCAVPATSSVAGEDHRPKLAVNLLVAMGLVFGMLSAVGGLALLPVAAAATPMGEVLGFGQQGSTFGIYTQGSGNSATGYFDFYQAMTCPNWSLAISPEAKSSVLRVQAVPVSS